MSAVCIGCSKTKNESSKTVCVEWKNIRRCDSYRLTLRSLYSCGFVIIRSLHARLPAAVGEKGRASLSRRPTTPSTTEGWRVTEL